MSIYTDTINYENNKFSNKVEDVMKEAKDEEIADEEIIESNSPSIKEEIIIDPILKEIAERLRSIDPDNLSPRESQEVLYAMIESLQKSQYYDLME